MTDLGPVPPCQADPKRGAHQGIVVVPESTDGYLTWVCASCAAMRRIHASAPMEGGTLDNLTFEQIAARLGWPE